MLSLAQWGALAGGIGLFLLGMWLMTDGLRLAAGSAMRGILARSTATRWRALASGFGLTALVQSSSAVTVATVFHTLFNVMGVLLMWPLADRLGAFLGRRFRTTEEDQARPRYLDASTAKVPALGVEALSREVGRFGAVALHAASELALPGRPGAAETLARAQRTLAALDAAIDDFVVQLNREGMAPESARRLGVVLRRAGYYTSVIEQLAALVTPALEPSERTGAVLEQVAAVRREAGDLLGALDPERAPRTPPSDLDAHLAEWDQRYRDAKAGLLDAAALGTLPPAVMEPLLRSNSALRRMLQQAHKALVSQTIGPGFAAPLASGSCAAAADGQA